MAKQSNPDELKTAPLSVRVKPSLKVLLEELAHADQRSLASYIEIALQKHVEREMGLPIADGRTMTESYRRSLIPRTAKSRK
jgi:predicted transcriptional regulator